MNNISRLIFDALWEHHRLTEKEEDISSWIDWWLLKHESLMAYCMEHRYDGSCVKGLPCGCIAENELKCFTFFYYDFENITSAIEEEKEIFSAIQAYKKGVKLYRNDANLLYNLSGIGNI